MFAPLGTYMLKTNPPKVMKQVLGIVMIISSSLKACGMDQFICEPRRQQLLNTQHYITDFVLELAALRSLIDRFNLSADAPLPFILS